MDVTSARDRAVAFLLSRIDYERALAIPYGEREFRLDRMRSLLARLGNPQNRLAIVHVAGTKGKGSTSAMIAAVLSAAGIRTGLYTSPHLDRLEERLVVDGQPCSETELAALVEQIRPIVVHLDAEGNRHSPPEPPVTYFEITTAMAMLHFAQVQTGAVVLEVGLGGRLDSTNVCQPLVSVITSISFDHTKQLGNTLGKIAAEKAGIIKPGVPVVSGVIEDEPRTVIAEIANERSCRLLQAGVDFSYRYQPPQALETGQPKSGNLNFRGRMDYLDQQNGVELRNVELGLLGRHQAANAAVALATIGVLKELSWELPEAAIRKGLAELHWPARVEIVARQPSVIVDGAHNVASIESLLATLDESFIAKRRILVFATTQDKDACGMLARLLPKFDHIVLTEYLSNPRVMKATELEAIAAELSHAKKLHDSLPLPRGEGRGEGACSDLRPPTPSDFPSGNGCDTAIQTAPNPTAAWQLARNLATPDDLICITGSFFLAAEMRHLIERLSTGELVDRDASQRMFGPLSPCGRGLG